jgi:hypothetical protein
MAITAITPATNAVINPGDSFAFTIDDTYTSLVIQAVQSGGTEQVYSSATGAAAGYTVEIVDNGATKTITVLRDSGWNIDPTVIYVTEDESGASVQTTFSYDLILSTTYPEGMQPYNSTTDAGDLVVRQSTTIVRSDVSDIRFIGLTVADNGEGSVTVTSGAGSGDVVGPAGATDNAIARFDSTTGKLLQNSANSTLGDQSGLALAGTDAHVALTERATAPTSGAAKGYFWVKSNAPSVPYFTDDTGEDFPLRIGEARFRKLSTLYDPILYYNFDGGNLLNTGSYGAAGDLTVAAGSDFIAPSQCGDGIYGRGVIGTGTGTKIQSASIASPQTTISRAGDCTIQTQMWITGASGKSASAREPLLELASNTSTVPWWRLAFGLTNNCTPTLLWNVGGVDSELTTSGPAYSAMGGGQMLLIAGRFKPNGGNMDVSLWMNGQNIAESLNVAVPSPTVAAKFIQFGEVSAGQVVDDIPRVYEAAKMTAALSDAEMLAEWEYINGR